MYVVWNDYIQHDDDDSNVDLEWLSNIWFP
jgi:hypothetical protein